jgi:type III secretion protein T
MLAAYQSFAQVALLVGLAGARIAVAFLLLPVFAPDLVPPMVRNAFFAALALLTLALQPALDVQALNTLTWVALFGKEALLGLVLGFALAAFLWAFEAAGHIVDTKIAVVNGALPDAMSGDQLTPTAVLLSRLATFLFMASGGFMLFVAVLVESYRVFPLGQLQLVPRLAAVGFFERHFADLMALALLLAAPALVVMFALDLALGLVNRYAPQLNLIGVSMSLKGVAGIAVWMLVFGNLVQAFGEELARRIAAVLPAAQRLFGG